MAIFAHTSLGCLYFQRDQISHEKGISCGKYKYPVWAEVLGWFVVGLPMICIPWYAVFRITKETGSLKEVKPCEFVLELICGRKLNWCW